ncbi:tetratricopeptide repeat protein [Gelidibacter algens]|uniref:tetratricopeptide repeat protein n=1 Tax=Gelidibacter algens TaxID=49280 RepID=UPI0011B93FA8|nr:tetratricopeptide repeat protein [Gelidibacter algens]
MKRLLLIIGISTTFCLNAQTGSNELDLKLPTLKDQLELAKNNSDSSQTAQVYLRIGNFFNRLELYSEAIKNYQNYLDIHRKKDSSLVNVKNIIATIHLELKNYEEAKIISLSTLRISEHLNYQKGKAISIALLGSVAEKQGNYKKALEHQNISLSIFQSLNDSTGLASTYENIGSIYEDLDQFDFAYQYFKKAQTFAKNSDTNLQINILNNLGDVNRKTGNYYKAVNYTEKAFQLAEQTGNTSQVGSALKDFARTHAALGDFAKAYEFLNRQSLVNEVELKRNNSEIVSALQVLYEVKEKEAEVQLLNKQNQINKVRQYIILIVSGAIILSLALGLLYWKKRRWHEKQILEYQQQLLQADLDKKMAEEVALKREIDIKVSSLTSYSLNIAHKNKMLFDVSRTLSNLKDRNSELVKTKLQELVEEIESDLSNNNEWIELMGYFGQIHPTFFENIKNVASEKLSSSEMRLCMLLRLNLSSKEIAEILHITSDSVRIARYRVRKKLPINSKEDLQAYLLHL